MKTLNKKTVKFGDYIEIEMKRFGVPNEVFIHKVVNTLRSNSWVDVPVKSPATQVLHSEMADVVSAICCGVDETEVLRYRAQDVAKVTKTKQYEGFTRS